ncbi:hypothetical protein RclHR1_04020022 [Rhizophagus clarus]|uniref:Uncharacterized protein n=1 Tax=Rhizophagus clarus TaxID=94130 RepID=A0A2Z6REF9_9GLOM|nr:hypothetical protein RclHR1_04020022 [Rhizophagus clarus]GES89869.1 hypothetical protein RCL_e17442_RclHR1_04020022 [Rhizophagus clarus]
MGSDVHWKLEALLGLPNLPTPMSLREIETYITYICIINRILEELELEEIGRVQFQQKVIGNFQEHH